MDDHALDLGFTTEAVPECHHLCLIYDNEEQRQRIVSKYLAAGIRNGEIVRYFTDTTPSEEIHAWLSDMGLGFEESEAFRILSAESAYCPGGHHAPRQVLDNAIARYGTARQAGFSASRACGEMTWVLRNIPDADRFLEYEVGLNMIEHDFPRIGMCQYDARRFDGATLFKVLQVHPYMVAQGQIIRNPFYIQPEEFLKNLKTSH